MGPAGDCAVQYSRESGSGDLVVTGDLNGDLNLCGG